MAAAAPSEPTHAAPSKAAPEDSITEITDIPIPAGAAPAVPAPDFGVVVGAPLPYSPRSGHDGRPMILPGYGAPVVADGVGQPVGVPPFPFPSAAPAAMELPPSIEVDSASGVVRRRQGASYWAILQFVQGPVLFLIGICLLIPAMKSGSTMLWLYGGLLVVCGLLMACASVSTFYDGSQLGYDIDFVPARFLPSDDGGPPVPLAAPFVHVFSYRPSCCRIQARTVSFPVADVGAVLTSGSLLVFRMVQGNDVVVGRDPEVCRSGSCSKTVGVEARALACVLQSLGNQHVNPNAIGECSLDCCELCVC